MIPQTEILQTDRLLLRRLNPEVYQQLFTQCTDDEIMKFLGFSAILELESEKEKFSKGMTSFNKSFLIFQLIHKQYNNIIGWCGYHTWYLPHARAEIGYALTGESSRGKGLMSEAIKPVLTFGFSNMNLHRIEAFVGPDNIPSLKLLQKFGFVKEGLLREHYFKNGVMEDSVLFSLLKKEFEVRPL